MLVSRTSTLLKSVVVKVLETGRDDDRPPHHSSCHPSNVSCLKVIHPFDDFLRQFLVEFTETGIRDGLPGVHNVSSRHIGEDSAHTIPLELLRIPWLSFLESWSLKAFFQWNRKYRVHRVLAEVEMISRKLLVTAFSPCLS